MVYNKSYFKNLVEVAKETGRSNGEERKEFLSGIEYIICNCVYSPRKDSPIKYGLDIENINHEMLVFSKCRLLTNSEKEMLETYEEVEPMLKKIYDSGKDEEFLDYLKEVVAIFFQEDDRIDGVLPFFL